MLRVRHSTAMILAALSFSAATSSVAQERFGSYPAARMGGNYMHNFYLPPAVNSAPEPATVIVAGSGSPSASVTVPDTSPRPGSAAHVTAFR